jgi:hypothetical protein
MDGSIAGIVAPITGRVPIVRSSRSAIVAAWLALLILCGGAIGARAQDYPRLGLYGSMYGDGYPLWDSTGAVVPAVLDQVARYHEVILDASPITPYRPDVALAIRARRPDIRLLAYVTGQLAWNPNAPDSTVNYPTLYWRAVRDLDGFLYNQFGQLFGTRTGALANVNLAKRDLAGNYVVANALASLFYNSIVSTRIWDGIFVDVFCDNILWMETPAESIDIARAGYTDRASFAVGWKAATDTLAARLRRMSGPAQVLVGNCAGGTKYAMFNGWMRENFPFQGGGTWTTNMFNDPGGYLVDETRWVTPRHNYIFSASSGSFQQYSAGNARAMRFGLGSAALGDGYGVFGPSSRMSRPEQYMAWWYDEYAVNLGTGAASQLLQDTGWLGQPLGSYYQMAWITPAPDAVVNPGFETDITSGWRLFTTLGATASRDTTTAMEGSASIHVTCATASPGVVWGTTLYSLNTLPLAQNAQYSATFWAKAATPRTIVVASDALAGGIEYAAQLLPIDTQWRRYQVVLVPSRAGAGNLALQLAGTTGDVWFDDVHFQPGASSVYRRDFQNGTVLVNPGFTPDTVTMERPFQRIQGTIDPVVNNGARSATQVVGAMDALFLIGSDQVPPSAVRDLHPAPPGTATTRGARPRGDR